MVYSHCTVTGRGMGPGLELGSNQWVLIYYVEMFTMVQDMDRDHEPLFLFVPVRFPPLRPGPVHRE